MSKWENIETAPKDGTLILLAPHMMTAWWESGDETWMITQIPLNKDKTIASDWQGNAQMFYCLYADAYGIEPTHWMELPEPPVESGSQAANEKPA